MSLEGLAALYATFTGPEWEIAVVAVTMVAVIAWESWERNNGNYRPVLNIAGGIMLSFFAGMSVQRGIGRFRSGTGNYRWIIDVLAGFASLVLSILYIMRRTAKTRPRGIVDWLFERDKPR